MKPIPEAGSIAQLKEGLPSLLETLSSITSATKPGVVVHICNLELGEVEEAGSGVKGHPNDTEFKGCSSPRLCDVRPCHSRIDINRIPTP